MAQRSPLRKLQNAALVQVLEDALKSGEPLGAVLERLGIHRSTLSRELKRDLALGLRIENAMRIGRLQSNMGTVGQIAAQAVAPPVPERAALVRKGAGEDSVAMRDWLPALLVLVAEIGLAVVATSNLVVVGLLALLAIAYLAVVWRLWRVPLPAGRGRGLGATPIVTPASDRPRA